MDKARRIIRVHLPHGIVVPFIINSEDGWIYLRAYETARLFGFKDVTACIRNHVVESKMIILPTAGGKQPVKCIDIDDIVSIAEHSRLDDAKQIFDKLTIAKFELRMEELENKYYDLLEDKDVAIDGLEEIREQLNEVMREIQ